MHKTLYEIFKTFFKIGTLLLGGGYVILPLLQSEIVNKKQWIDSEELCEYYALSQSLPGIIAVNTATFVGHKLKGLLGAFVATFGVILPAFLAIILLATLFQEIVNIGFIKNIFYGIGLGVILLLTLAVKEMWGKCIVDKFTCYVFLGAFILSSCFKMAPALIVILAAIVGILYKKFHKKTLNDFKDIDVDEDEFVEEGIE